jgi:hypothetical protein
LTAKQSREAPVLIAGGGLIGLSMAMFPAQHGIRSIAIERLRVGSPLPRAAYFHLRTIELFRAAGVEQAVIAQSALEFLPEGAIVAMDSLSGRKLADIIPSLNAGVLRYLCVPTASSRGEDRARRAPLVCGRATRRARSVSLVLTHRAP